MKGKRAGYAFFLYSSHPIGQQKFGSSSYVLRICSTPTVSTSCLTHGQKHHHGHLVVVVVVVTAARAGTEQEKTCWHYLFNQPDVKLGLVMHSAHSTNQFCPPSRQQPVTYLVLYYGCLLRLRLLRKPKRYTRVQYLVSNDILFDYC